MRLEMSDQHHPRSSLIVIGGNLQHWCVPAMKNADGGSAINVINGHEASGMTIG